MPLFFQIEPSLPTPAYRQIVAAVEEALRSGELREGERLPSIRALARQLAINPNTVARAYRELEYLGLIASQQGSGFEVRGGPAVEEAARAKLRRAADEAFRALGSREVLRLVRERAREIEESNR